LRCPLGFIETQGDFTMRVIQLATLFVIIASVSMADSRAFAGIITGDFREEASFPTRFGSDTRVLEALGRSLSVSDDELTGADEQANPGGYSGSISVDVTSSGLITLTGSHEEGDSAIYQLAVITISNIALDTTGEVIGITTLSNNIVDTTSGFTSGTTILTTAFSSNSVTITYSANVLASDGMDFGDGNTATFQIQTSTTPEPSSLTLAGGIGAGMIGFGWLRRRRKQTLSSH
jgi:hypothetical protein